MISIERARALPPPARDATSSGVAETRLPTRHGDFTAYGYRITVDEPREHVALVYGDIRGPRDGSRC